MVGVDGYDKNQGERAMYRELKVNTDGSVVTIYTDALDLAEIGTLDIQRASTVEFSNRLQSWIVSILPSLEFSTREGAIMAEVECLNKRIALGQT